MWNPFKIGLTLLLVVLLFRGQTSRYQSTGTYAALGGGAIRIN